MVFQGERRGALRADHPGYEDNGGGDVVVSDLELEAIEPRRTRTIDIEQFVDLASSIRSTSITPTFLPASEDDGATRAYRLLAEVMGETDRLRWAAS